MSREAFEIIRFVARFGRDAHRRTQRQRPHPTTQNHRPFAALRSRWSGRGEIAFQLIAALLIGLIGGAVIHGGSRYQAQIRHFMFGGPAPHYASLPVMRRKEH